MVDTVEIWGLVAGCAVITVALCSVVVRVPLWLGRVGPASNNPCHRSGYKSPAGLVPVGTAAGVSAAAVDCDPETLSTLAFAVSLCIVGLLDDRRPYTPLGKMLAQLPSCCIALFSLCSVAPLSPLTVFTLVCIIALTNALNVLDVADGLAPGVSAVTLGAIGFMLLENNQFALGAAALSFSGAAAGFLLFNASPARLILGDAGSLSLGGVTALFIAHSSARSGAAGLWAVPLLVLVPAAELIWVSCRRIARGIAPWQKSPHHFVYWLLERGMSAPRAVFCLVITQTAAVCAAMKLGSASDGFAWIIGICSILGTLSWLKQRRIENYREQRVRASQ